MWADLATNLMEFVENESYDTEQIEKAHQKLPPNMFT